MRKIRWIGVLAGVCLLTSLAAAYEPAPMVVPVYQGGAIPAFRGQACTMPVTFAPGPIAGERVCCCCAHAWDGYCLRQVPCGDCGCQGVPATPDGGQLISPYVAR